MKAVLTRKVHPCAFHRCAEMKVIKPESAAIMVLFKSEGSFKYMYFHLDCYVQSVAEHVRDIGSAVLKRKKPKKVKQATGRPRISSDPLLYRKLISLRYYHSSKGHEDKVKQLDKEIKAMRVGYGKQDIKSAS